MCNNIWWQRFRDKRQVAEIPEQCGSASTCLLLCYNTLSKYTSDQPKPLQALVLCIRGAIRPGRAAVFKMNNFED